MPRLLLLPLVLFVAFVPAADPSKKGTQYAFLVASAEYDKNELKPLPYSQKETYEFRQVLLKTGFDEKNVKFLHDKAERRYLPERKKIADELDLLLGRATADDTVVVLLNGHGVHFTGDATGYFCPVDAKLTDKTTLLPMDGENGVFPKLKACKAKRKVLLVNACRNDPASDRSLAGNKIKIDDDDQDEVPEGIAALYSCKPGERSYYYDPADAKSKGRERSLYMHHLIEAWGQGGKTTIEDVFKAVRTNASADADELFGRKQNPVVRREYRGEGDWLIAAAATTTVPNPKPMNNSTTFAQSPLTKPDWIAGHNLRVRKGKETDWEKSTKLGLEVYKDGVSKAVLVITSAGHMAATSDDALVNKKADWNTGLIFSVRTADEEKFTKDTALYGAEVFKNAFNGQVLFMTEKNTVALYAGATEPNKDPVYHYGLKLRVRKPGVETFDGAKAFGLEAYKDTGTGALVYITQDGFIAVAKAVPAKVPEAKDVKRPRPLYGIETRVRKFDEVDFSDKTQKFLIEVFKDENTGTLLYISDAGSIAAVPPPAGEIKAEGKPKWSHAMILKPRPGGEQDFEKGNKYGIEVFTDTRTGYTLFVNQNGSIAVLPVAAK